MHKVPWEIPSIDSGDFEEINKLWPYTKEVGAATISKFESDLASYVGVAHASVVNNGSSALICALLASGIQPGDKVAVPTYTFASVVNSIILMGGVPILVDSEHQTFNMSMTQLEKCTADHDIKAVIHVDVGGHPPDLGKLIDFCKDKHIALIEDGAEALGSAYKGKKVGAFDHATTLSFHPAKQITTMEGGAILTNNDSVAKKLAIIRNHGMTSGYEHTELGFNFRMTPFEAAFGISQLKKIDSFIERRNAIANRYSSGLDKLLKHQESKSYVTQHAWGAFLTLVDTSISRDSLLQYLFEKGIEARVMWKPVHLQDYHKFLATIRYPVAEDIFHRVLSLPIGNGMSSDAVDYVINSANYYLEQT